MPYRPLLEIAVTHPYAAEGTAAGVAVVPDAATAARLRGLRLVAKPVGGRLVVFGEFGAGDALRVPIRAPVTLTFGIEGLDPDLAAATDLAALGPAPLFTDERAGAGDPQPLRLVRDGGVAGPQLATIAVRLSPAEAAAAATGAPRRCVAALPVAAARWCYHLVTNLPNPLAEWRITRGGGASGPAPAFADGGRVELADAAADDPAGAALRRQNPGLRVLRFVSDAPFAARQAAVRSLELHAGTARLFGSLPNPPPGAAMRVGGAAVFGQTLRVVTA